MDAALYGLLITVTLNSLLFIICLALFLGYRKLRSPEDVEFLTEGPPFREAGSSAVQVLKRLYKFSGTELGFYCRPEGFLYLSVIKHMAILLGIFAVIGASVLIPIYETGNEAQNLDSTYEEYSVANVKGYNHQMAAPAVSTLIIGAMVYYLAYRFFKNAHESELVYRTVRFS